MYTENYFNWTPGMPATYDEFTKSMMVDIRTVIHHGVGHGLFDKESGIPHASQPLKMVARATRFTPKVNAPILRLQS